MKQTAMMEILDMLQVQNPLRAQMLEKEKQQIIDAYIDRIKDTYQNRTEAEQYYNQTFKQD
jgi:hypothetical protein